MLKLRIYYISLVILCAFAQLSYLNSLSDETNIKFKDKIRHANNDYYLIENPKNLKHFKQNLNLYFKWNKNTHKRLCIDSLRFINKKDGFIISMDDYPLLKGKDIKLEDKIEDYLFFSLK